MGPSSSPQDTVTTSETLVPIRPSAAKGTAAKVMPVATMPPIMVGTILSGCLSRIPRASSGTTYCAMKVNTAKFIIGMMKYGRKIHRFSNSMPGPMKVHSTKMTTIPAIAMVITASATPVASKPLYMMKVPSAKNNKVPTVGGMPKIFSKSSPEPAA